MILLAQTWHTSDKLTITLQTRFTILGTIILRKTVWSWQNLSQNWAMVTWSCWSVKISSFSSPDLMHVCFQLELLMMTHSATKPRIYLHKLAEILHCDALAFSVDERFSSSRSARGFCSTCLHHVRNQGKNSLDLSGVWSRARSLSRLDKYWLLWSRWPGC